MADLQKCFRVLSLDGGGPKGFYTIGVLKQLEISSEKKLYEIFDFVYGTSTGSIIAALVALGFSASEIYEFYREHVPAIMNATTPSEKSKILAQTADVILGDKTFYDVKTDLGVVTVRWEVDKQTIFKSDIKGIRDSNFKPGFGVKIGDAVQASCSFYPFFDKKVIALPGVDVPAAFVDGGYAAVNPTLYSIVDATEGLKQNKNNLRVLNVGVGSYPLLGLSPFSRPLGYIVNAFIAKTKGGELALRMLDIQEKSSDALRGFLFRDIQTMRISETFNNKDLAVYLFESDLKKLDRLYEKGSESYESRKADIKKLLFE